ncbi:unnamed protein product, partial [Porites lobata]
MTKDEIQHFFGVEDHNKVPEYDVASPYLSNNQGDFVSYSLHPSPVRSKRDADHYAENSYYKLDTFGKKLHLRFRRNEHLLAPDLKLVRQNGDGTTTSHPAPPNTFYLGHVVTDPGSTVALSNDGGLTGLVKTSRDTFLLHPLPVHLAKHVTSSRDATPHLVYRRSFFEDSVASCKIANSLVPYFTDEADIRSKRSMETKDSPTVTASTPVFKTLKAALLYPEPLRRKYSGSLNNSLGSVENYLLIVANMVAGMFQDPSIGKIKITYVITNVTQIDPKQYKFSLSDSSIPKLKRLAAKIKEDNKASRVPYDVFSYVSNLGLGHDGGYCGGRIMSGAIPGGEHASEWSECSRKHQCAHLKCIKDYTLLTKFVVVADGTKCGPNEWCIKGRCSDRGMGFPTMPPKGPGKWSNWGSYSVCSGECGNGFQQVQHRSRQCIKPVAEASCKGPNKEYRTCQIKVCSLNDTVTASNFRQNACRKRTDGFNNYYLRSPCQMWCRKGCCLARPIGQMPDGTICRQTETYSAICVQGSCRIVGCDNRVDSKRRFDRCGVCGGNASTCTKVSKEYTDNPATSGPGNAALIVTLPPGTRFAKCEMKEETTNYLGVQDAFGNHLVGGHLGNNQVKEAAGSLIHYSHQTRGKDIILIKEPTNATLRVMYIRKGDQSINPRVKYTLIIPTQHAIGIPGLPVEFDWINENWSGCSKSCASGIRTRTRWCIVKDDRSPVNTSACGGPPEETEPCNTQPCEAKWVMKWTSCSKTCGKGKQVHTTKCLQQVNETLFRESDTCKDPKPNPPPVLVRFCNEYPCPPQWIVGNWSKCPLKCRVATIQR